MKGFVNKLLLIMVVAGIIMGIGGFSETMLILKDKTINLNTAKQSDFDEPAMVEGEIDFVYGPFATLEETETRFGFVTDRKETNFYIVGNFDSESYMEMYNDGKEFEDFYVVLATSNYAKISVLDMASEKWGRYLTGEYEYNQPPVPPQITINFSGKLTKESDDDEYISFKEDALETLEAVGVKDYQLATLKITDGEVGKDSLFIFFGGIALFLIGVTGFIWSLIAAKRRAREIEFY